jgi:uncharacterized membrane protein
MNFEEMHMEETTKIGSAKSQFGVIFALFIVMRLTITCLFNPGGLFTSGQITDYAYYYSTAHLSEQGYFPFINMWYEYFPILAYIPQLAYKLSTSILPAGDLDSFSYLLYSRILQIILLPFEVGILILTYSIAQKTWSTARANQIGWYFISLSLPLYYWVFSHNSVMVFFFLLAMVLFLNNRFSLSAIGLGLGVLTKLTPLILIPPVVKFLWPQYRKIIMYSVLCLLTVAIVFLPFIVLGGGEWILASLVSITKGSSTRTIWAMMDGNWDTGYLGPLLTRIDLDKVYNYHSMGNPPKIPPLIPLLVLAIGYAIVFFKKIKQKPAQFIWITTLTVTLVHLWFKSWSPQWATLFITLLLLSFPDMKGLVLILLLTGTVILEWPLGAVLHSKLFLSASIIGRTILFIYIALLVSARLDILHGKLRDLLDRIQPESEDQQAV